MKRQHTIAGNRIDSASGVPISNTRLPYTNPFQTCLSRLAGLSCWL
ncbi:hypothetical protein [uncultured Fibrella sp.]